MYFPHLVRSNEQEKKLRFLKPFQNIGARASTNSLEWVPTNLENFALTRMMSRTKNYQNSAVLFNKERGRTVRIG